MTHDWLKKFREIGMLWQHDGNPKRPYAKLTSGMISDGFVNCSQLITRPRLLHEAVHELLGKFISPGKQHSVIGQAMGSITIGHVAAFILESRFYWAVKTRSGGMEIDPRFLIDKSLPAILVEDVTSTGETSIKSKRSLVAINVPVLPIIYSIVNRSGKKSIDGMEIRSLIDLNFATWDFGNNPHVDGGLELVRAVRPKEDNNWDLLNKNYA